MPEIILKPADETLKSFFLSQHILTNPCHPRVVDAVSHLNRQLLTLFTKTVEFFFFVLASLAPTLISEDVSLSKLFTSWSALITGILALAFVPVVVVVFSEAMEALLERTELKSDHSKDHRNKCFVAFLIFWAVFVGLIALMWLFGKKGIVSLSLAFFAAHLFLSLCIYSPLIIFFLFHVRSKFGRDRPIPDPWDDPAAVPGVFCFGDSYEII
mmetsp:Transcript_14970/g.37970  ORF Transcript_14970/g.37970 Transcript_14970/m.37970 type:complete len:213 (-) Transcript_14970:236-874(-)|eukprot:CAMPEP_0177646348 /NCGR_PEP_ID=MMETSP0447-20121125/9728_1 /TAXON_ID=0 /ORGANISM="Stygamoeba regulata, Strain BSH-02190019" /LENGTH=212 /DNA_ID=CAMNT_0019148879 /DNA_START=32 /DNA_END=670 /DNA_ORIENTATION=-